MVLFFPIVHFLQTKQPRYSHIWRCPIAEFSFPLLPLHAAGPYRKGQQNLVDLYVSSYTPTLAALIRARRHNLARSTTRVRGFVAIGQTTVLGQSELASIGSELAHIGQRVDTLTTYARIEGPESGITCVTQELVKSNWASFPCHGIPNRTHPFQSVFALYDGHFTVQKVIPCNLEGLEFPTPPPVIRLPGTKRARTRWPTWHQRCSLLGFAVIGTMCAVDDGATNNIMSMFYDNMKDESGHLDYTRAAFALNKTMKKWWTFHLISAFCISILAFSCLLVPLATKQKA